MDTIRRTRSSMTGWQRLSVALPLAGMLLGGCSSHLVAPAPGVARPAGSESSTGSFSGPSVGGPKTMSVRFSQDTSDAKLVKIYDNLGVLPSGKYWGGTLLVIVGGSGNTTFPDTQMAAAFTPSADHTATKIEAAIVSPTLGLGTSGFVLSLNADDNGVPGRALISAQLPGLPDNGFGLCCALVIGTIPNGVALSGGTQYWLVLDGQSGQSSDGAGWAMNDTDQVHTFLDAAYCSVNCPRGPGWYPFQGTKFGTGAAFAVLGN